VRLGRVVGTCVVSACVKEYEGRKLLVVEPVARDMEPEGRPFVAVDAAGAGTGSEVIWVGGREACYATEEVVPADAAVVAIWEP